LGGSDRAGRAHRGARAQRERCDRCENVIRLKVLIVFLSCVLLYPASIFWKPGDLNALHIDADVQAVARPGNSSSPPASPQSPQSIPVGVRPQFALGGRPCVSLAPPGSDFLGDPSVKPGAVACGASLWRGITGRSRARAVRALITAQLVRRVASGSRLASQEPTRALRAERRTWLRTTFPRGVSHGSTPLTLAPGGAHHHGHDGV